MYLLTECDLGCLWGVFPKFTLERIWGHSFCDTIIFFLFSQLPDNLLPGLPSLRIRSQKKVSFSFVCVHSSCTQSSPAVTDGESLEPALCYRGMLAQLRWHCQTLVLAQVAGDKSTSLSCPCQLCPALGSCNLWRVTPV